MTDNLIIKLKKLLTSSDYRLLKLSNRGFYSWLSDDEFLKRKFKIELGKDLNLENPQTFCRGLRKAELHK